MIPLSHLGRGQQLYFFRYHQFSFFIAKSATVTVYLLESCQARFKKCRLLFCTYGVFARDQIKNGNILLLLSSLSVSSSTKESQKFILRRNFPALVACKSSKFVTKETSLLFPQTPWQSMRRLTHRCRILFWSSKDVFLQYLLN